MEIIIVPHRKFRNPQQNFVIPSPSAILEVDSTERSCLFFLIEPKSDLAARSDFDEWQRIESKHMGTHFGACTA